MNARFDKANELTVAWQVAPGYYLYRDKLTVAATGNIDVGAPNLPEGDAHTDDNFGDVEVYPRLRRIEGAARPRKPRRDRRWRSRPASRAAKTTAFAIRPVSNSCRWCCRRRASSPRRPLLRTATSSCPSRTSGCRGSSTARGGRCSAVSTWPACCSSFTPCVLPMVPILSSIIAGQGGTVSTQRGFLLSLSYVLGMAATYTAAGAVAALAGNQVQALFQKPWLITIVRRHVRRARARHVRPVRAADAGRDSNAAREHGQSPERPARSSARRSLAL